MGIIEKFGPVFHELSGAPELGGVSYMDQDHVLETLLSCGKPRSGIDVIVLDGNKEGIRTAGVPGKIFAKGLDIAGDHKPQGKTKEFRFGGYFSVGFFGYFDEDGYLHVNDRIKDGDGESVDGRNVITDGLVTDTVDIPVSLPGPDSNPSTSDVFKTF